MTARTNAIGLAILLSGLFKAERAARSSAATPAPARGLPPHASSLDRRIGSWHPLRVRRRLFPSRPRRP